MNYKSLVVNLAHRNDRREYIMKLFKENNINEYEFYNAVNGKTIDLTLEIKNTFKGNDFSNRKGFIGCALSHYYIWMDLVKDDKNDFYIIYEDDITLCDNYSFYLDQCINKMNDNKDLDLLYIGFHKYDSIKWYDDVDMKQNINIEFIDFHRGLYHVGGTFGYIISKNGAKGLIKSVENNHIQNGVDYFMKINDNNIKIEMCKPSILYSEWVNTNNSLIDTDIQKDFDCFNFNNIVESYNYQFIPKYDQFNNDYELTKYTNLNDVFEKINKLDIDGFNTLGYIKSHINLNNLTKCNWMINEQHGIYIKLDKKYKVKLLIDYNENYTINNSNLNNIFRFIENNNTDNSIDINTIDYFMLLTNKKNNNNYDYITNYITNNTNTKKYILNETCSVNNILSKLIVINELDMNKINDILLDKYLNNDIRFYYNLLNKPINYDIRNNTHIYILSNNNDIDDEIEIKDIGFKTFVYNINSSNLIELYKTILKNSNERDNINYVILGKNNTLSSSYINFINHILYVPDNYDLCYINNNDDLIDNKSNFKIINQINPLYYQTRKYYFNCTLPHIISKNGLNKVIEHINMCNNINNIYSDNDKLFYNLYNNIKDLNFYINKCELFTCN